MVNKTFAQAQAELEKGCGKECEYNDNYGYCSYNHYCSLCQAKLSQLKIDKEIAREMMKGILNEILNDDLINMELQSRIVRGYRNEKASKIRELKEELSQKTEEAFG